MDNTSASSGFKHNCIPRNKLVRRQLYIQTQCVYKYTSTHLYNQWDIHMQVELSPNIAKNKVIQELVLKRSVFWGAQRSHSKCPAHRRHDSSFHLPITANACLVCVLVFFFFPEGMEKGNAKVIHSWAKVF